MADVTIDASVETNTYIRSERGGPFWRSTLIGYMIYIDADASLVWTKTTDGGDNWSAANTLVPADVMTFDAWADWQTPGDTGTIIHVAVIETNTDTVSYCNLDTSDDSESGLDTIEAAQGDNTIYATPSRSSLYVSITKARGGNIGVAYHYRDNSLNYFWGFYTSPDHDTWTSADDPWEAANGDQIMLFPGNETDDEDLWALFWDGSANEISLKTYDDSGDSWSEQSISGSMIENTSYRNWDGDIRQSDGHLIVAAWNAHDNANADLQVWDVNGAGSITAKTNVITDEAENILVAVFIDQVTDDIYIAYAQGTAADSQVAVVYQKSTDGGANWDGETSMQADAEDDERWISSGGMTSTLGGVFLPVWFNDDLNDLFCNTDNAVTIAAAAAGWSNTINGVDGADILKVNGVAIADIAQINGVA